ncbi:MAG: 16S rRNA (adenine(1518)-N(6)/adenine(1519)-N(6))-dimethyltransferase RsmA [Rhodobiaceae bacterium]|nr:16S rRNA (adenine(1518)-N(6)/adenine(1519)-N(6))-dimethyltransferase RsmA [Rhodobiaceae bacterium]MCC0050027.1 16S rRNA (adenine(1518)-N(6)/adenine(1519)-N(6))-dimethyltransferase RsmA [Rhodobiaceae bacterium]
MSTSALDALPPLRDVIADHGLRATKALGQNFLLDLNLTRKIARAAGPLDGVHVLEVGPGPGGLTRALLLEGASRVTAIEKDARCLEALSQIAAAADGRLNVVEGDALECDHRALMQAAGDAPCRIVANLPYNVATPLLTGWLAAEPWPAWFDRMVLMFQREVAERIVAKPGDAAYGRLAVLAGWRSHARIVFDVPPQAFTPPPKVVSSVVQLVPKPIEHPCRLKALETVTRAAFGQRRKMLRQSLKPIFPDPALVLREAGIDETARAETVSIEGFAALARALGT